MINRLPTINRDCGPETQVEKFAAALLLESRIGQRFDALVTCASDKGTWVRLLQPPVKGRQVSGCEGLDVGHRLRVQLLRTDVERDSSRLYQ